MAARGSIALALSRLLSSRSATVWWAFAKAASVASLFPKASVNEMLDYAAQKGIKLGFENREKFEELPLDADYPEFLAGLPATAPVGYWHDTGHADIKEGMGLLQHRAHLEKLAPRTLGFHLHDVTPTGEDHHPLGAGRSSSTILLRARGCLSTGAAGGRERPQ